jgi:phosphoribosylanthranilate isomerase
LESAPGKKDRQALEAFVRAVRMVEGRERLI